MSMSYRTFWVVHVLVHTKVDACFDKGPWNDPDILKMVYNGEAKCSTKILILVIEEKTISEDENANLKNPWDVIQFSGNSQIHLDFFLSVFNVSGLPEEYYHNSQLSSDGETFVDGAVIAAARTLPTWSDRDMSPIPSAERKATLCQKLEGRLKLQSMKSEIRYINRVCICRYRLHRKMFVEKVIQALDIYQEQILF
ncbi:Protein PLASTID TRANSCRIPTIONALLY ACTIVE 14 [Camellia lanceoleosa]|uniref:Protein PLASTID TRANSCRIPTIONALLY ACTIVE 14 n=1 Tax=Camellia lanceoleosa TaxID=1840588 RepID=A0ACC0G202_9ERIC|nr:Protein PLASTID TRANSCRIPTIONALLY ACTIVE 14 [Camellia lanceoleosa]